MELSPIRGLSASGWRSITIYSSWSDESGQYAYADLVLPDAGRVRYLRVSPGTYFVGAVFQHSSSPTIYDGSTLTVNPTGGWTLALKKRPG